MRNNRFISKIDVRGQIMKVYLYEGDRWEDFCRKEEAEEADAFFDPYKLELYFNTGRLTLQIVRHELVHAYLKGCFFEAANLNRGQIEEVMCETMAYFGDKILTQADSLYAKLKEPKKPRRKSDKVSKKSN